MILTPQQAALEPLLEEHLRSRDPRALMIEGVSGVGKSSLVQHVLQQTGQSAFFVPELTYAFQLREAPDAELAVMEYSGAEQILALRKALGEKVRLVLLAHPQFLTPEGAMQRDHVRDLQELGLPTTLHRLSPMSDLEARAFAEQLPGNPSQERLSLVERYGLGISAQVRHLLKEPDLNEERAEIFALAHLHRILQHAHQYHNSSRPERAIHLLGREFSHHHLGVELHHTEYHSLERELAKVAPSQAHRLPRYPETLALYRRIFEENACLNIEIFVPEIEPGLLEELGFNGEDFTSKGRLLQFSGHVRKAGLMTRTAASSYLQHPLGREVNFEQKLQWKAAEQPVVLGENPLYAQATAHGGCRFVDHPLFPYAIETLLQVKGIPYLAVYVLGQGQVVRHQVSEAGVKIT